MATLVDLLEASADRFPAAEAVVCGQSRVSYAQLWKSVLGVAGHLNRRGVRKGDCVALLLENSPQYIAGYYGILLAGGIAVPLNTAAKAADISRWLIHSGARWLFASPAYPELNLVRSKAGGIEVMDVGACEASESFTPVRPVSASGDAASIIYTSGSTGDPKGVTLSHGNLVANVRSILTYLKLDSRDRILNVLPFYYSYGNSVLHTHLATGAGLVLENSLMYLHEVMSRMQDERVTGFSGVPSTFALLLSRVDPADYALSALRYLTQAGGRMSVALTERVLAAFPDVELFVMYGQTEATARISYLPPDRLREKIGSVGVPIPGVEIEIRDEHGARVADGGVGEICIRGDNIMLGYWRNEAATRRVLQDGWLRTGDTGHMDRDGFLLIHGRNSDMIKSGANRISPEEIEEVIAELPDIQEVAVVGVADDIMGEVIKAFVVPRPGRDFKARDIQRHCRERLAVYKIPKYVEFVDELPRTASGKLRRFLLAQANNQKDMNPS